MKLNKKKLIRQHTILLEKYVINNFAIIGNISGFDFELSGLYGYYNEHNNKYTELLINKWKLKRPSKTYTNSN